jgi:nicotinamide-nucleotide amidase
VLPPEASPGLVDTISASGLTIAVAESLTGGLLSSTFAAMDGASTFFRGGVVAYASEVKFRILGVTRGPVIRQSAADELAIGAHRLLRADLTFGVTGVGGPGREEGRPPGTVFITLRTDAGLTRRRLELSGHPENVCHSTCLECLSLVEETLGSSAVG